MKRIYSHIILWLVCIIASANPPHTNDRLIDSTYYFNRTNMLDRTNMLVGMGYTNQYDTYISPLEYTGPHLNLLCESEHLLKKAKKPVSFQSLFDLQMHTSASDANSLRMYGGDIHYDAGWYYNWHPIAPKLTLKAGGQIGGTLGGLYCNRSGNNPANAHAAIRLSASVGAQYILPLRHTTLIFRYQADLPMLGAAFSPDYGQSYYELSEHGYSHNICATSPFNAFSIRQLATIDIRLKHGALIVGYKADIRQAELNHLRQHQYAHSLMIGWTKKF